jgi:hypothetical protein
MPGMGPKIMPDTGLKLGLFNKQINNSKQERENRLSPSKKIKMIKLKKNLHVRMHPARKFPMRTNGISRPYPRCRTFLTPTSTHQWKAISFSTITRRMAGVREDKH